jgi:predicted DNA-binding protein
MNRKNFLGEELYNKMNDFIGSKRMTIATFVRLAIESYIERG